MDSSIAVLVFVRLGSYGLGADLYKLAALGIGLKLENDEIPSALLRGVSTV